VSAWDSIIGHQRVTASLRRAVQERCPHHALLLLGPAGVGKMTLARLLAMGLVCDSEGDRPCQECASCRKVASGAHTDVWTEEPTGKSKTITVDQVASIQRRLSFRRGGGDFRVVLVDDAGSMNEQSQNKLLKTLEEPPEGTVIVLCALHPGQLLVTVRSRCQKLPLGPVDPGLLSDWLRAQHGVDEQTARTAAAASHGLPGLACTLMDPETLAVRAERLEDLCAAMGGDRSAIDRITEQVGHDRELCTEVLMLLQELLRDAMVEASGQPVPARHGDARPLNGNLADRDARHLAGLVERAEATRERLSRNVHPGWLMEDLLLHLATRSPWP
jgi:DNA polymerase III subunit delta'